MKGDTAKNTISPLTPKNDKKYFSPDVPGLVVGPLRGGVDGGVGDAEGLDHAALGLHHALDGLGVDGDVAGLGTGDSHLAPLLVAV